MRGRSGHEPYRAVLERESLRAVAGGTGRSERDDPAFLSLSGRGDRPTRCRVGRKEGYLRITLSWVPLGELLCALGFLHGHGARDHRGGAHVCRADQLCQTRRRTVEICAGRPNCSIMTWQRCARRCPSGRGLCISAIQTIQPARPSVRLPYGRLLDRCPLGDGDCRRGLSRFRGR